MGRLVCFRREDWNHFCSRIDFGKTFLDADAIRIMNEPIILDEDKVKDMVK